MSWYDSPWVFPVWVSMGLLDVGGYFLPILGKFLPIISSNIFSFTFVLSFSFFFILSFSSGMAMIHSLNSIDGSLTLFKWYLRLYSLLFILFPSLLYLIPPLYHPTHLILLLPNYSTLGSLQSVFNISYCIVHY